MSNSVKELIAQCIVEQEGCDITQAQQRYNDFTKEHRICVEAWN